MKLTIGHLYGDLMNIYGDKGNIITLQKRAEWRGIEVEVKEISVGGELKAKSVDLFFFGGGQDQAQQIVSQDLLKSGKGKIIKQEVEKGTPLLSICGGYQLLGEYYQPHQGPKLLGVGLFSIYTVASFQRMIGNIVVKITRELDNQITSPLVVGFENHSGKTYLKPGAKALGKVVKGFGNNGEDQDEGCIYKNALGCYMHGSLLPKNPDLADWLISKALQTKYQKEVRMESLDDDLENLAHDFAVKKFS